MNLFTTRSLVGVLSTLGLATAMAAERGPFFEVEGGANWMRDTSFTIAGVTAGEAEFDTGFRAGLGAGYNFNRYMGAQFDTGFLYNEVKHLDDVWLGQVPILGNLVFRYENTSKWVPFIGGGAGGAFDILRLHDSALGAHFTDDDLVFAWQGFAGLRYKLSSNTSIGVAYRYLGSESPHFRESGVLEGHLGHLHNHSANLIFSVGF